MPQLFPGSRRAKVSRHSLYARSALFLVLGSGSLLGAVVVLSSIIVEESVDRLLRERIDLARTAGEFLEHQITSDLDQIVDAVRPLLESDPELSDPDAARDALAGEYRSTLFSEGVLLLDREGRPVVGVPDQGADLRQLVDLADLSRRAHVRRGAVTSRLVRVGSKPVLVLVTPIWARDGRDLGALAALLQPASTNLLDPVSRAEDYRLELGLVDRGGMVVATTDRDDLFRRGDHGDVLASAIREDRDLQGRCHSCHRPAGSEGDGATERATEVLAFAPLPTLDLGVAVHQAEEEALAPAFALRRRLFVLGFAFVTLFLIFAGLSVRSVVRPITRLTRAVREVEATEDKLLLGPFGKDEVGQLAHALETWRRRMMDSLAKAEASRAALDHETEATRRHLAVLQDIAAESTGGHDVDAILENALIRALSQLGLEFGVIELRRQQRRFIARKGLSPERGEALLGLYRDEDASTADRGQASGSVGRVVGGTETTPRCQVRDVTAESDQGTLVAAALRGPLDLEVTAVLGHGGARKAVQERWIKSLLRHLAMSASNRLLREADLERQEQQRQLLYRVLTAQEDERRRVARELHDTLAQDLAALRLEVERLSNQAETERLRARLAELEQRAHDMLATVRSILLDLRLSVLESMGFLPALRWHLERLQQTEGIRGTLVVDGDEETPLGYEMAVTLFRIFQESVLNVVQHAQADHVFVTVAFRPDLVEMIVEDDGKGFDARAQRVTGTGVQDRGLGILGMEERAHLLEGELHISSSPGEGTTVTVRVPMPAQDEQSDHPLATR